MRSEFRKHWDNENGFTQQEAYAKKAKVDEAHEVGSPKSRWKPAEIVLDPYRRNGYMVVIETK